MTAPEPLPVGATPPTGSRATCDHGASYGSIDGYRNCVECGARFHEYLSTACLHAEHDRCRLVCKFCDGACSCPCHDEAAA